MWNAYRDDATIGRKLVMLRRPRLRERLAHLHNPKLDELLADYALASRAVQSSSGEYVVLCEELADEIERLVDQR